MLQSSLKNAAGSFAESSDSPSFSLERSSKCPRSDIKRGSCSRWHVDNSEEWNSPINRDEGGPSEKRIRAFVAKQRETMRSRLYNAWQTFRTRGRGDVCVSATSVARYKSNAGHSLAGRVPTPEISHFCLQALAKRLDIYYLSYKFYQPFRFLSTSSYSCHTRFLLRLRVLAHEDPAPAVRIPFPWIRDVLVWKKRGTLLCAMLRKKAILCFSNVNLSRSVNVLHDFARHNRVSWKWMTICCLAINL